MDKMKRIDNPLRILVNEQLCSVIFVKDYLQLDFDVSILNCFEWPVLYVNNDELKIENSNYRNLLCELISSIVLDVILRVDQEIEIIFQKGRLIIELDYFNKDLKEIVQFKDIEGNWSFF